MILRRGKQIYASDKQNYRISGIITQWNATTDQGVIVRSDGKICEFVGLNLNGQWGSKVPIVGDKIVMYYYQTTIMRFYICPPWKSTPIRYGRIDKKTGEIKIKTNRLDVLYEKDKANKR